jgi:sulfate/thiosulfate transport system ATP-binding protein
LWCCFEEGRFEMPVSVHIEEIRKNFATFEALRGVSLAIEPSELVALLGPSGSGKTTLLRMIAGLAQPDHGRILFNGVDSQTIALKDRRIGFVFQNYALFRHMTVFNNIAYGLQVRPRKERPNPSDMKGRVMDLIELMQLNGLEGRYPAQLSGGQCQRVALARALAIEPQVLLLDEPFGALDAKVRKDLRAWLREVHERTGHTTVFVTHDQEEALELADRVAILNKGQIEQLGTPEQIYNEPASVFVCAFLGESSRFHVQITNRQVVFAGKAVYPCVDKLSDGDGDMFVRPDGVHFIDPSTHVPPPYGYEPLTGVFIRTRLHGLRRRAEVRIAGLDNPMEIDLPATSTPFIASLHAGCVVQLHIDHARVFSREGAEQGALKTGLVKAA